MNILDAHVHLWDPRETPRLVTPLVKVLGFSPSLVDWVAKSAFPKASLAFVGTPEYVTRPYLPADFEADRAHHPVRGVVHVEADWRGRDGDATGETAWLEGLRPVGAGRIVGMAAHVDLGRPDAALVLQRHLDASARVCSVRHNLMWHPSATVLDFAPRDRLTEDPTWRAGLEQLGAHGLAFEATCYDGQLDEIAHLAKSYPAQRIALCHMGIPVAVGGPFGGLGQTDSEREVRQAQWRTAMARVAENPNVVVKLSGLGMPVCGFGWERRGVPPDSDELAESMAPFVRFVLDAFGPERCLFASNFPVDKASFRYTALVDAMVTLTSHLTPEQQRGVFEDNARRFYGLGPEVPDARSGSSHTGA